jgi:CheY-like chemotaxis protein
MRSGLSDALRVLIVEDDPALRTVLLDVFSGYVTAGVGDGAEALARLAAFRPHLVVLDLRLPRLDGFAVCRQLRAGPQRAVRVLAISTSQDGRTHDRAVAAGADAFLSKPFSLFDLERETGRLLSAAAP